jgi:hypothetical protein
MSDYNDDMVFERDRDDRHSVIESAEVLGPVFAEPVEYSAIRRLTASPLFERLKALVDERALPEH